MQTEFLQYQQERDSGLKLEGMSAKLLQCMRIFLIVLQLVLYHIIRWPMTLT